MADTVQDLSQATVAQLLIPVEDLATAVPFYRDTLGIPFLFTAPPQMSFFQCGAVRLLVGVPEADQRRQRGSMIYFKVADIKAVHARLAEHGVAFTAPPHLVHRAATYDLWLAEFTDPDGNQLALMAEVSKA
ncbi:MAG: VOC family protein [Gemmatimonadaceae bacterium]